jgi:hypothetical protein
MSVFLGAKGVMRPSQLQRRAAMARYRIEGFSVFGLPFSKCDFHRPVFHGLAWRNCAALS